MRYIIGKIKKHLKNIVERIRSRLEGRTETQYTITVDDTSVRLDWLTLENERCHLIFTWDKVRTVEAYKRDLFVVDCICLSFETSDRWVELNEDMDGWDDLITTAQKRLPKFPTHETWWETVALPAFETNHMTLWKKVGK